MSGKAVGWAMEQRTGNPAMKLVLVKLADNANEWIAWPSVAHIAADTELSASNVRKQLRLLEGLGLIKREARSDDRGQISNVYHLLADGWVPRYKREPSPASEEHPPSPRNRGGLSQEEGALLPRRAPPSPRNRASKPLSEPLDEPLTRRAAGAPVDRPGDPALWALLENAGAVTVARLSTWGAAPAIDGDRVVVDFTRAFAERYVRAERAKVQAAFGCETVFRYAGREGQP